MNSLEIIDEILKYTGLNTSSLARCIGLPRDAISDIKCGKVKGISKKLQQSICEKFPQFNPLWILTGEGSMLLDKSASVVNSNIQNNGSYVGGNGSASYSGSSSLMEEQAKQITKLIEQNGKFIEQQSEMLKSLKDKDEQFSRLLGVLEKINTK